MDKAISNIKIEKFFNDEQNEDLKKLYGCLFNGFNKEIYKLLWNNKKRNAKYLFAIFNTDRHNESGTHWWSVMNIHPRKKNLMLYDSLGLHGFKIFIVDNDKLLTNYFSILKNVR